MRGRFYRNDEDVSGAAVAVIGADVDAALFPSSDSKTRAIRIAGRRFTVIGVQSRVGSTGAGSVDKYVWIPLRAYERALWCAAFLSGVCARPPGSNGD